MMENKNLPAFPDPLRGASQSFTNQSPEKEPIGLTKREYFAAMAMSGWLASFGPDETAHEGNVAAFAVRCADALLAELEK